MGGWPNHYSARRFCIPGQLDCFDLVFASERLLGARSHWRAHDILQRGRGLTGSKKQDLQAAILASRQAPTSPSKDTGAQSSTPRGSAGLPDEEDRVVAQIRTLMTELVDLESRPQRTIMQNCRMHSIQQVLDNLQNELNEIESRKASLEQARPKKSEEKGKAASSGSAQPSHQSTAKPSEKTRADSLELVMSKPVGKDEGQPAKEKTQQQELTSKPKEEGKPKTQGEIRAVLPIGSSPPPSKKAILVEKDLALSGPPPKSKPSRIAKEGSSAATFKPLMPSPRTQKATPPPSPSSKKRPAADPIQIPRRHADETHQGPTEGHTPTGIPSFPSNKKEGIRRTRSEEQKGEEGEN